MSWHTRRLYALENEYLRLPDCSLNELRDLMVDVWNRHAPVRWRSTPPKLEFGAGTMMNGQVYSYAEGRTRIVLVEDNRDKATLIHEITHTLRNGDVTHGPRFVSRYFGLLVDEGVAALEYLTLAATRHRLDPRWIHHFDKERNG